KELEIDSYSKLNYLINNFNINYSYSVNILFDNKINKKSLNKNLTAFAPTYDNINSIQDSSVLILRETREFLIPIPFAKTEVKNISKFFRSKIYIDEDASENTFKKSLNKSGIMHLAMHTIVNENDPLYSKLVFSINKDSVEDGFLNAFEIYNLKTKRNLIVLSACKTGFGKLEKGEGIMSIAQAFAYAGCPSVVMTLWSVEDKASSEIMTSFYKYLAKGKNKPEALRLAKLNYLQTADPLKSHPFFWAGYVQIGDISPVFSAKKRNSIIIILILGITAAIGIVIWRRNIR
ncbi:CHAT domain-containing protein, partial [Bacteroidota bacterium]